MDKKRTTKELLKAAGVMSAAVMCPCIIAFGLGMAQAGPTADGEAACTTAMLDTIALATPSFTANQDIREKTGRNSIRTERRNTDGKSKKTGRTHGKGEAFVGLWER